MKIYNHLRLQWILSSYGSCLNGQNGIIRHKKFSDDRVSVSKITFKNFQICRFNKKNARRRQRVDSHASSQHFYPSHPIIDARNSVSRTPTQCFSATKCSSTTSSHPSRWTWRNRFSSHHHGSQHLLIFYQLYCSLPFHRSPYKSAAIFIYLQYIGAITIFFVLSESSFSNSFFRTCGSATSAIEAMNTSHFLCFHHSKVSDRIYSQFCSLLFCEVINTFNHYSEHFRKQTSPYSARLYLKVWPIHKFFMPKKPTIWTFEGLASRPILYCL